MTGAMTCDCSVSLAVDGDGCVTGLVHARARTEDIFNADHRFANTFERPVFSLTNFGLV
jgi:hypothetical protein